MEIARLQAAARRGWFVTVLAALVPAGGFAADPPISRMEASTVRVLAQTGQGGGSTGSGFVIGDGSYVVTNHHVIAGAQAVVVVGRDLKVPAARVVADDPAKDLAILQLTRNSGRPATVFAPHSMVTKTQTVLAAGFPGAADDQGGVDEFLDVKFSKGIISAFVRAQSGTMLYQIDAPINPGNSGGPLFDECGNVVGINAMKSLRPAVVVGPDGSPSQERLPYGEGVAWAIQADELVSLMTSKGLNPVVATRSCRAGSEGPPSSAENPRGSGDGGRPGAPPADSNRLIVAAVGLVVVVLLVVGLSRRTAASAGARQPQPFPAPLPGPAPIPFPSMDIRLRGMSGPHAGREFPVTTDPITLGRDPQMSQIVFDAQDSVISKRHCVVRLDRTSGGLIVEDCGSTNGTFLESGERLRSGEPRLVRPHGSFYLGDRRHLFQVKS